MRLEFSNGEEAAASTEAAEARQETLSFKIGHLNLSISPSQHIFPLSLTSFLIVA